MNYSQGSEAGAQISGSGSRHLNFLASALASRRFWLRLQNDLVHWKLKTIAMFVLLACPTKSQTRAVEPEPKFQVLARSFKCFWLRLQSYKIAWAPAPQPCFLHFFGVTITPRAWVQELPTHMMNLASWVQNDKLREVCSTQKLCNFLPLPSQGRNEGGVRGAQFPGHQITIEGSNHCVGAEKFQQCH